MPPKTTLDVPTAKFIRLDLFPATITGDQLPTNPTNNILDVKRIIVTDENVLIFSDGQAGPHLMYSGYLTDFSGKNTTGYHVETEDFTAHVKRSNGCGCGSRLRALHPYQGVPFRLGKTQ